MPRIEAATTANTPAASAILLEGVQKKLGMVPNLFKTIAHSPAALKFYFGQGEALATGKLSASLRHQIALVTSGVNNCDYCASAHTLMGKGTGLQIEELTVNLLGQSADAKVQAALTFSKLVLEKQGHVSAGDVHAVKAAGFDDAAIMEIIANVAATVYTNLVNNAAGTVIDFPLVKARVTETV
ncbi:MAG: carboxymuconolactone decarboxylase family protein [Rhodoferax sp.]|uniref:carboxymuconolactone decarboxylase family protein n=1 Tax=Rhodoferax sp. TaxID=50421 RepID=UPI00301AF57A